MLRQEAHIHTVKPSERPDPNPPQHAAIVARSVIPCQAFCIRGARPQPHGRAGRARSPSPFFPAASTIRTLTTIVTPGPGCATHADRCVLVLRTKRRRRSPSLGPAPLSVPGLGLKHPILPGRSHRARTSTVVTHRVESGAFPALVEARSQVYRRNQMCVTCLITSKCGVRGTPVGLPAADSFVPASISFPGRVWQLPLIITCRPHKRPATPADKPDHTTPQAPGP